MLFGACDAAAKAVNPPREFPATTASARTTSVTNAQTSKNKQRGAKGKRKGAREQTGNNELKTTHKRSVACM